MSTTFHPYPHVAKVYPPGKPAGAATQHVPVLIVGGGPVGLATALGLARSPTAHREAETAKAHRG